MEESLESPDDAPRARSSRMVLVVMLLAVAAVAAVFVASRSGRDSCGEGGRTLDGIRFDDAPATVTAADGTKRDLCVLVADTGERREHGLMGVKELDPYDGMVFVSQADSVAGFWMKNTPMPLSIGWFASDGRLVSTADMEPCLDQVMCTIYSPTGAYRYALEVPKGKLADLGVAAGAKIELRVDS